MYDYALGAGSSSLVAPGGKLPLDCSFFPKLLENLATTQRPPPSAVSLRTLVY